MRVAPTDDTIRPGPLTTAAGTGDDGRPPGDRADPQTEATQRAAHRVALARELGALACTLAAVAFAVWSLYALIGPPAIGLGAAVVLIGAARALAYHKPV